MLQKLEEITKDIKERASEFLGKTVQDFSIDNVHKLVVYTMEKVDDYNDLDGAQKKEFVVNLIRETVEHYLENNDIEESKLTRALVDAAIHPMVLGSLIDMVVSSAKGEFNLKLTIFKKLVRALCGCC